MNNSPFTIEDNVFVDCPVSYEGKVVVPDGIIEIGDKALMYCNKVNQVELPDSLEGIGMCAFHGCNFKEIKIPEKCQYIADAAFLTCMSLREIDMPEGMLVLTEALLCGCDKLERVGIPDSVRVIRESAFADCSKLKSVKLPVNLEKLDAMAFAGCKSLKEITIPDSCRHLCYGVFKDCSSLKRAIIGNGVSNEQGGENCFLDCTSMTYAKLSSNMVCVLSGFFEGCM